MDQTARRYHLVLISLIAVWSACDAKFECDAHPDRCPGLDIKITSSSIIKRLAPGRLDFSVAFHEPGKPEDPEDVKAVLVFATDVSCRQALTTDSRPQVALDLPAPTKRQDGTLVYSVLPTVPQLDPARLGPGKLCVYGRDIGAADIYIMNKLVTLGKPSTLTEKFAPFKKPMARSISVASNKRIYLLFSYDGGVPVRNMKSYTYAPFTEITPAYSINNLQGGQIVFDPALAAPNGKNMLVLRPNASAPTRVELYLCDQNMTMTSMPCPTDASNNGDKWNIMDNLTALTADRNGGAFFVATKNANDLQGYDISSLGPMDTLASKALWTADKPSGTASDKTILALGDLVGAQPRKPDGKPEVIAVQSGSHSVSVVIQPSMPAPSSTPPKLDRNSTYSDALQAKLLQVLTPPSGGMAADISALAAADLDGDGLADIVAGFNQQFRVLFNMGDGTFRLSGAYAPNNMEEDSLTPPQVPGPIIDIAVGDLGNTIGNALVVLSGSTTTTDATLTVYPVSAM